MFITTLAFYSLCEIVYVETRRKYFMKNFCTLVVDGLLAIIALFYDLEGEENENPKKLV